MKLSLNKFKEAVEQLRKEKIAQKGDVAAALGFNHRNKLTEILAGRQNLTLEHIVEFCKIYNFDQNDFIYYENDNPDNYLIKEIAEPYQIDTIKSRISIIENQFDTILKGQESLRKIFISGADFMNVQTENIITLKKLVGA